MSQQINLYNPLFLKQEKHFSARTMAHALGVVALAIGAVFAFTLFQTRSAERLATQYREQLAREQQQVTALVGQAGGEARSKALESEVARLEAEIKRRRETLQALSTGELGNTEGFSEFLAALGRQALPGVWRPRIRVADAGTGPPREGRARRAGLLPAYLRGLSREPMMQGRRVTEMKVAAAKPGEGGEVARFVEFLVTAPRELREPGAAGGQAQ